MFYFTNTAGTIAAPEALDSAFYADDVYIDQDGINLSDPLGGGGAVTPQGSLLVNISTRGEVLTGDQIMIAGFVISGTEPQKVLIRAVGPALVPFGVAGALAAPVLALFDSDNVQINANTGWDTAANAAEVASTAAAIGAFEFAAGSADSALLVTLAPGSYTAKISGAGGTTGVALAEVYSVSQ